MKRCLKNYWLVPSLAFHCGLVTHLSAQTFNTLHTFSVPSSSYVNSDGWEPMCDLSLSENVLFGTTLNGGPYARGTIFKLNSDGTGFSLVYGFPPQTVAGHPFAGLALSGSTFYGTTAIGSNTNGGTVFKVNADGTGFTVLHDFNGAQDGYQPRAGVTLSGDMLFGTALLGGGGGNGTVFSLHMDGTGFTNLHSFTNVDGASPYGAVVLSGNTLFGATFGGGSFGMGTVFAINTDGTAFKTLHNFASGHGTNPGGNLVLSGNTLYGTTLHTQVSGGNGTVFTLNTDGTGFNVLHAFFADGEFPHAGLYLAGNTLYGTTWGPSDNVFRLNVDGTGFSVLHWFNGLSDGAYPYGGVTLSDGTLYGATQGGALGYGTVFSLSLMPPLAITSSSRNMILTWPTNSLGFTLQSTTNLVSPLWTTNLPAPVIINGQYTVTNSISGRQRYFRLSQ